MKEGLHPAYYQAKVVCNCGNEFVTGSTKSDIHVEICSKCHPFYTGQQKATAARGRIDKFNRKYGMNNKQVRNIEAVIGRFCFRTEPFVTAFLYRKKKKKTGK